MRRTLAREKFTSARLRRAISLSTLKVPYVMVLTVTKGTNSLASTSDKLGSEASVTQCYDGK